MASNKQLIYIGADHRGFSLKEFLKNHLKDLNFLVEDCGAFFYDPDDDFNDFALKVAQKVSQNPEKSRGIVICGSGIGADIVANKVKGIRCGLIWRKELADHRKYYGENVLSLPADFLTQDEALEITKIWLQTKEILSDEKYERRRQKLKELDSV